MSVKQINYVALAFLLLLWVVFIFTASVSVYFSLFWYFWWLDIAMHIYGGVLIIASWFMVNSLGAFPRLVSVQDYRALLFLGTVIIGWEVYEYAFGLITPVGYVADTAMDLAIGFGGGLAAFLLFRSRTIKTS